MSNVFVVDTNKRPLSPIHPREARRLLTRGKASVLRRAPFTIILKEAVCEAFTQAPLRLKIDPGSRTTGLALLNDASGQVVWAAELSHRGELVHKRLVNVQAERRGRRARHTRYRPARFRNRRRPKGWLPPSFPLLTQPHRQRAELGRAHLATVPARGALVRG